MYLLSCRLVRLLVRLPLVARLMFGEYDFARCNLSGANFELRLFRVRLFRVRLFALSRG